MPALRAGCWLDAAGLGLAHPGPPIATVADDRADRVRRRVEEAG